MKVIIDKLPDKSDRLTTKEEAIKKIELHGQPTKVIFRYKTFAIVSLNDKAYMTVPYEALDFNR